MQESASPSNRNYRQYIAPVIAMLAAFVVYYCMYGFRKPFTVAAWEGATVFGVLQLKTAMAIAQVFGYTLAKLWGTRVCSGVSYNRLIYLLYTCIFFAGLSLLSLPYLGDYMVVGMFFNGLSLGMVWGLVMRPLEGRQLTEFLIAGLCVSFIIAGGHVKSTGAFFLQDSQWFADTFNKNEAWMPFVTSMIYLPFLVVAALVLFKMPRPTNDDKIARHERKTMEAADRLAFLKHHAVCLIPLAITYFLLTAFRDYRDLFQKEMFVSLGIESADAFARSEEIVAFGVIVVLSIFVFIKKSLPALVVCHVVMAGGLFFCGLVTWLMRAGHMEGMNWMVLSGFGAYVCYIAFHCIVFERMVAYTRAPGNSVFALMLFDFIGYVAATGLMVISDLFFVDVLKNQNHLDFFVGFTWILTFVGGGAVLVSMAFVTRLTVWGRQTSNEVVETPQTGVVQ